MTKNIQNHSQKFLIYVLQLHQAGNVKLIEKFKATPFLFHFAPLIWH